MTTSWLQRKRKGELIELAERANMPGAHDLLKDDLVEKLFDHLLENESDYAKQPIFQDFYGRGTRNGSPVKRERSSPSESFAQLPYKTRRRTLVKTLSTEEPTPEKALITRTPQVLSRTPQIVSPTAQIVSRTPQAISRVQSRLSQVDIPASPAQLAEVADQSFQAAKSKATELWDKTKIDEFKELVRENASSVTAIQLLVLVIEATGLQWNTLQTTPLSLNSQSIPFPDLSILLTSGFWAPATLWSLTSVVLPLIFSYFCNLTLRSNTNHKTLSKQYTVDPLTFNIVRAILAYNAYHIPTISAAVVGEAGIAHALDLSWGPFAEPTVGTVRNNVPGGYYGLQIGSVVGVLYSLYDAALKK